MKAIQEKKLLSRSQLINAINNGHNEVIKYAINHWDNLCYLFPWFKDFEKVDCVNDVRHKNIKAHTFQVMRNLKNILDRESSKISKPELGAIMFGALMHDIGKSATKQFNNAINNWTFLDHEKVGAVYVRKIISKWELSSAQKSRIYSLIRWHGQAHGLNERKESGLIRFIKIVGDEEIESILQLSEADITTKNESKKARMIDEIRLAGLKILKAKDAMLFNELRLSLKTMELVDILGCDVRIAAKIYKQLRIDVHMKILEDNPVILKQKARKYYEIFRTPIRRTTNTNNQTSSPSSSISRK